MLCRQKGGCADYILQKLNAQILQVGVPLKVLSHICNRMLLCFEAPGRAWSPSA